MTIPAEAVSAIRVARVRLIECQYEILDEYDPAKNPGSSATIDFLFAREFEALTLSARLGVRVFEKAENAPFRLFLGYEGTFEVATEQDVELLRQFGKYNAFGVLLPYLREAVTAITSRSGYVPLVLPLLNLRGLVDKVDESAGALNPGDTTANP